MFTEEEIRKELLYDLIKQYQFGFLSVENGHTIQAGYTKDFIEGHNNALNKIILDLQQKYLKYVRI